MHVACSTRCFSKASLDEAMRSIAELNFHKLDLAINEKSNHLKPSEVVKDVGAAATRLRSKTGVMPAAITLEIDATDPKTFEKQFQATCELARVVRVPLITLPAAPHGSDVNQEVARLKNLVKIADRTGILLAVPTWMGTLPEDPDVAVDLCQRVLGLGLTLDPSHYAVGMNQGKPYDHVYPFVKHVHLRDTGRGLNQFQVHVGQGEIEYSRVIAQLSRFHYNRLLTVDIQDTVEMEKPQQPEVRKLKFLLESLV